MTDSKPVQHVPVHLRDGGPADKRHPAASSFAPLQPAAGVVADDVEEKGQNLRGGPTASEAEKTYADVPERLVTEHYEKLRAPAVEPVDVEGDKAKAPSSTAKK
jgi:hypothetical protein